jgi:hypothetical protein
MPGLASGSDSDSDSLFDEEGDGAQAYFLRMRRRSRAKKAKPEDEPMRKERRRETHVRKGRYHDEHPSGGRARWRLRPDKSVWLEWLNNPQIEVESSTCHARFRRRFRVPYKLYTQLLEGAKSRPELGLAASGSCAAPKQSLELKILAALRHLATGDTFDSLEDTARISESVLRDFTFLFVDWLADVLYAEYVTLPGGKLLLDSLEVYRKLGFPGA